MTPGPPGPLTADTHTLDAGSHLYRLFTNSPGRHAALLHDIPAGGGALLPGDYQNKVVGRLIGQRPLRLASFMGTGFRTMGASAEEVTRTPANRYAETDLWAEAAHAAGFEGIAWMSRQCDTDKAHEFFGDRVREDGFGVDPAYGGRSHCRLMLIG